MEAKIAKEIANGESTTFYDPAVVAMVIDDAEAKATGRKTVN